MKIIPYADKYLSGLIQVFESNVPKYFAQHEQADFLEYLGNNKATYFVAIRNDVVIGGGGYHFINQNKGRLSWDFIAPAYQKNGYGSELIEFCLHQLYVQPKLEIVEVWTSQHSQGFYKKLGFKKIESRMDYWSQGLHLVVMYMGLSEMN